MERALAILKSETDFALALAGIPRVADLDRSVVRISPQFGPDRYRVRGC